VQDKNGGGEIAIGYWHSQTPTLTIGSCATTPRTGSTSPPPVGSPATLAVTTLSTAPSV
jgi:hypothetical protein